MSYSSHRPELAPEGMDSACAVYMQGPEGEWLPVQFGQFNITEALAMLGERNPGYMPRLHCIKGRVSVRYKRPLWYRQAEQQVYGLKALPDEVAEIKVRSTDTDSYYGEAMDILAMIAARMRNIDIGPEAFVEIVYHEAAR